MSERAEPNGAWWQALRWFGVFYAIFAIWSDGDWILRATNVLPHGSYGMVVVPDIAESKLRGSWVLRIEVAPNGPASSAGFRTGDHISVRPWEGARMPSPGDQVTTRRIDGDLSANLTAVRSSDPPLPRGATLLSLFCCIPASVIGFVILSRSGRRGPILMGLGLATYGLGLTGTAPPSLNWRPLVPLWMVVGELAIPIQTASFLLFGADLVERTLNRQIGWLHLSAALWLFLFVPGEVCRVLAVAGVFVPPEVQAQLLTIGTWARLPADVLVVVFFVHAWGRSTGADRKRLTVLTAAMACLSILQFWFDLKPFVNAGNMATYKEGWWSFLAYTLGGVVAPFLFAYAILKDRILDIGFAVNRTLVYSLVSAILLGAFGLIEWSVDHFLKIEGREKNALIDAAIALGVFLTFHRVRDFVEKAVEALFFRSWQEKEARLRRYVTEAAFITDRDALLRSLCGALSKFADGAETAIYLAEGEAGFECAAGAVNGVSAHLQENDPALVTLRAERKPVDLRDTGTTIRAALCAPMTYGSDVRGFVLFGAKPEDADYRPDEIELIGWAVVQVGLDLHALEVTRLRQSVREANTRVEELRLVLARRAVG